MRICVLSYESIKQSKELYVQLLEELKKRFSSVLMVPIEKVTINIGDGSTRVMYRGKELEDFDVILPRIGPSYAHYGYLVLKLLEGKVYFPNKPESYLIARDKVYNLMVLASHGIPVPKTIATVSKQIAKNLSFEMGEPLIVKAEGRSGGKGVIFAKDAKSANTMIDAFSISKGEKILLEEFIEAEGDVRLFVIGNKVHAAAMRVASERDIRSNIHAGGRYVPYEPDRRMKSIAVKAAKVIGADICGVDIMVGKDGPKVLECNMNPGFMITKVTGVNLFKRIADYLYDEARRFYSGENILTEFIAEVIKYLRDHL